MPESIEMHDPERAWQVWSWLEALEWRWPPDVMLRQDEALMEDLATISWLSGQVKTIEDRE